VNLLVALIALHWLCDFPLQNDFLARAKNHQKPLPGVPWWYCLVAHAGLQAAGVALVLPPEYALAELIAHTVIDWAKSEGLLGNGELGFVVDQALHLGLRAAYAGIYVAGSTVAGST
jgi:hypothetical protein